MPVVVGQASWKAVPTGNLTYLAHPVNQKMFHDRLTAWGDKSVNPDDPVAIFYFEAFDEPWKATANPGFNDDNWGLFNVNRQARYVVHALYPASQWEPGSYTLADAVYAPTVVSPIITADRYTIYVDATTQGKARAPAAQWFGFDSPPNAFAGEGTDAALAAEGSHFMEVGPAPSDYGWGIVTTNDTRADLSQFQAIGRLNFSHPDQLSRQADVWLRHGRGGRRLRGRQQHQRRRLRVRQRRQLAPGLDPDQRVHGARQHF